LTQTPVQQTTKPPFYLVRRSIIAAESGGALVLVLPTIRGAALFSSNSALTFWICDACSLTA
jgi:hypothetical protein